MKKRYVLLFLLSIFLGLNIAYAEVKTYNRDDLDNYGVNKDIDINSSNKSNIKKTPAVDADEKIYDFADILTDDEEATLYKLSKKYYDETGMELIYLTADFSNTTDSENEDYAVDFYDYNDFGLDDKYYSGVIVFRNSYASNPYYAIYNFGEAQYYYTDSRKDYILDYVYFDMKNGNYLTAFTNIASELNDYYNAGIPSEMKGYSLDSDGFLVQKYQPPIIGALVIAAIATSIIIATLIRKNKMIYKEKLATNYLNYGSVVFTQQNDQFITSRTRSYSTASSSSGGGLSGGGSRSGSSGRGHSGGGRRG